MSAVCHRCGEELDASDLFCPTCGAPQVKFEAQGENEGLPANPRAGRSHQLHQGISWKVATKAALTAAVPAGALSAITWLSWGCCLWVAGGAMMSIGVYRRRAPGYQLNARSGLRIGTLAGIIAAYTSISITAVWRVIARFALHQGSEIDRFYDAVMQQSMSLVQSNPEAQAQMHRYINFFLSPDGRAAYTLMNAATTSLGIILFSALGGALGVRLFAAKKTPLSHP